MAHRRRAHLADEASVSEARQVRCGNQLGHGLAGRQPGLEVEAVQEDGVDVGEVDREDWFGLRGQELAPGRSRPWWGGVDAGAGVAAWAAAWPMRREAPGRPTSPSGADWFGAARDLMTRHEDPGVLGRVRPGEQHKPAQHTSEHEVGEMLLTYWMSSSACGVAGDRRRGVLAPVFDRLAVINDARVPVPGGAPCVVMTAQVGIPQHRASATPAVPRGQSEVFGADGRGRFVSRGLASRFCWGGTSPTGGCTRSVAGGILGSPGPHEPVGTAPPAPSRQLAKQQSAARPRAAPPKPGDDQALLDFADKPRPLSAASSRGPANLS
jgi:hypothetical protein